MGYQERVRKLAAEIETMAARVEHEHPEMSTADALRLVFSGEDGNRLYREFGRLDAYRKTYGTGDEPAPGHKRSEAEALIERFVDSAMAADKALTRPAAMSRVLAEHPQLYRLAVREHLHRAADGAMLHGIVGD